MTDSPDHPSDTPPPYQPYPYPPGSYPHPPQQQPYPFTVPPRVLRNGLGTASLVLAVIALLGVWSVFGGVILGVAASVLGIVAYGRVRRGEADNGGVAVAGIVLGAIAIVVGLIFIAIWAALWHDIGGGDYIDCLQRAGSNPALRQQCVDRFRENFENRLSVTLTPRPSLR
ncbi:DUF4190 domain-containing protein [Mycobacterium xenopi]|uniref:DUF4190 domain-containing protein n=1 Tax=Mycobacterium xenopi TaxID=1789 RepID=A0AAD1H0N7_MYCXE|nr:DUF4190 domain-containing protein [Mycobacterium xenopi]MDA3637906.1 DUF4190 domain-containing protein [Mycobacterium xenopi]MDA3660707.1 DUF4190 domain-containing protein [Mycobacterium xenopi]ORX09361.1 hypothetical protein AWC32_18370 [Mycobacterium xenopi]SPX88610.1 Uncharacterised protein [Mycobacterium xenopi]BBU22954.1 hypothetical protein MYXE_27440 [Mycobacterium xenopi]